MTSYEKWNLFLTGIAAISTITYMIFTYRLFKATKCSVDIARESLNITGNSFDVSKHMAFVSIMKIIEDEKNRDANDVRNQEFYEKYSMILLKYYIEQNFQNNNTEQDKDMVAFIEELKNLYTEYNIETNNIPLFKIL